jgi:hypothetical protein
VLIRRANVKHLMPPCREASAGKFHIYPVSTADQGIELTGLLRVNAMKTALSRRHDKPGVEVRLLIRRTGTRAAGNRERNMSSREGISPIRSILIALATASGRALETAAALASRTEAELFGLFVVTSTAEACRAALCA